MLENHHSSVAPPSPSHSSTYRDGVSEHRARSAQLKHEGDADGLIHRITPAAIRHRLFFNTGPVEIQESRFHPQSHRQRRIIKG